MPSRLLPDRERKAKGMPEILDHVAYLSQEIGPRPAGTEEEQQAALYITEQLQKEAGLSAVIEDFTGAANADLPRAICCGVTVVAAAASMVLPVLVIPAIIVAVIALALYAAEAFDRPVISKILARGVSQNVVAKYEPGYTAESGGSRRRKVILVSRYDSGKVRSELRTPFVGILPILRWVNLGAMVFIPLLLIIKTTLFIHETGMVEIILTVLMVIALIIAVLPVIETLVHKLAAYNEAANSNASGVAVLLDVASRIGRGRVSEAELAARSGGADIHGEEAARAAGLVPEGAELVYAASNVRAPEIAPQSEAARLAAAKAAVAALTGMPVSGHGAADLAENLVQIKEPPLPSSAEVDQQTLRSETKEAFTTIPPETVQAALANAQAAMQGDMHAADTFEANDPSVSFTATPSFAPNLAPASSDGVPDWFKKAQEKAKKTKSDQGNVHRSRYADALDALEVESSDASQSAEPALSDVELRLQSVHQGIMDVKVPQSRRTEEGEITPSGDVLLQGASDVLQTNEEVLPTENATPMYPVYGAALLHDINGVSSNLPTAEGGETCAMPPLDVSGLRLGEVPSMRDVPMPSFLNAAKVQAEKLEKRGEVDRTANRVDVTSAEIGKSGRIEQIPGQDAGMDYGQSQYANDSGEVGERVHRRPITLPDITASNLTPIADMQKQRAPLADAATSGKTVAKSLLTMLPSISPLQESDEPATNSPSGVPAGQSTKQDLRTALPSLSGAIIRQDDSAVNTAGSFLPAGATGAFAPVGDELLDNIAPEDIYVDDADDSVYEGDYTETGAFAGAGYVDMPKSRARRLFDKLRFRKSKDVEEPSPQEWLEVDETFDARAAGAARGGWESFREEGDGEYIEDEFTEETFVGQENTQNTPYASEHIPFNLDDLSDYEDEEISSEGRRRWNGGGFSRRRMGRANDIMDEEIDEVEVETLHQGDIEVPSELNQIYQFRNPDINTEVWFVALGSELAQHGGMRAFLAEHNQELRGSIIIDIDALGAGSLSMIEREGAYRKVKASSRMKRYTKKASQATGLSIETASILWEDSAASIAMKQGFQAMHLVGMDGVKPAYYAQGDDVLENVEEETLSNNADFIMELLKNI